MRTSLAVVAALAACGLVACGSGETKTVTVGAPSTDATTTATVPSPSKAVDKRTAKVALLLLEDMPTGWHATPDNDDDDDEAECASIKGIRDLTTARAFNDESFVDDSDSSSVNHAVYVFADEETAQRSLDRLMGDETRTCVRDRFASTIAERVEDEDETEVGEATVGQLNADPLGADTQAFRVAIPYEEYGLEDSLVAELIGTRVDRALSLVTLIEPDEELRGDVSAAAARKLSAAVD